MVESDIQAYLFAHFARRRTYSYCIPNFYGAFPWECDFLGVRVSGYADEYEIKLSLSDLQRDSANKPAKHGRLSNAFYNMNHEMQWVCPKRFYYVTHGFDVAPGDVERYAGLIVVNQKGDISIKKEAPHLSGGKMGPGQINKALVSLSWRYWRIRRR